MNHMSHISYNKMSQCIDMLVSQQGKLSSASEGEARASSVVFIFNPVLSDQTPRRWVNHLPPNFQDVIRSYGRFV